MRFVRATFDASFKNSGSEGLHRAHRRCELLQVLWMVLEGRLRQRDQGFTVLMEQSRLVDVTRSG